MGEGRDMKPSLFEHKGKLYVWSDDMAEPPLGRYRGPTAEISYDKTWLYIMTDPYEGRVMINIETLPALRKALAKVARKIARPTPEGGSSALSPAAEGGE